jgi:formate dehydrogenase major subunit
MTGMKMAKDIERTSLSVELVINGKKISAAPGQTILDVVRNNKIDEIPTLCYDPKLEPYGSCFLCVVEVKGAPRLVPACVTRIRDGMEVTTRSQRIVTARKSALELLLSDHYADCVCPGQRACPAGVDIQGYMSLAALGYYKESLDLIRERNPFPVVCGRVCVRKCEVSCLRKSVDDPVGINFVKRYVAEQSGGNGQLPAVTAKNTGKRVAIIGGGPGGLSCANYLAKMGHGVTIFESLPKLGGMLRYGIPEYRLPRKELDDEIKGILGLGVEVRTKKKLGKDFTVEGLIEKEHFDAVFIALGAPVGKKMGLKDEDNIEGISSALDFLRDCELNGAPKLKGKVAVMGAGNSAIDAARTAVRCGAEEVTILYRRTRKEMPAHHEEVDAAEKEGVKLELLVAPLELIADNGRLKAIRCQRMELGEPDASGRRKPIPIKGAVVDFACDYIFAAIGQDTDLSALENEPENRRPIASRWSTLEADIATMATNIKGVFAGGDVVLGPAAVIDAIAHGRSAALAIDRYLATGEVIKPAPDFQSRRDFFGAMPEWTFENVERTQRCMMPEREPAKRINDFVQVETGLDEPHMKIEASRCMECGCKTVFGCDLKRYAAEYGVDIARVAGEVRHHRVDRSHPLISLDPNKCILCGRCIRTCQDLVGLAILGFVGRGFATTVRPEMGKTMAESACIACGACVESCPTGALEARLNYGRQGPWKTKKTPSVCNFCSIGCDLDLNVVADGLLWATSPEIPKMGRGELCLKGRFGTGLIQGADRLRKPLVRKNGKLTEASWDEAFATAAAVLQKAVKEHGPESVGVMVAPRMTLEEAMLVRTVADSLDTKEVGSFGRNRRGGPRHDLDELLGDTVSTCTMADLEHADLILVAGADPGTTHPVLGMAVRRALKRGAEMIVVNSSQIDLQRPNDLWLDARRGTSGIIYSTMLSQILKNNPSNGKDAHKPDSKLLMASIASLTLNDTANVSGVDSAKIQACAEKLINAGKVVVVYDLDDTLELAVDDLKALAQLLLVTGHIDRPGEGLLLLRSDSNSMGAKFAGIDNTLHLDKLRAALIMLENPFGDYRSTRDLAGIGQLVVMDHFLTETARMAEVVLPAATFAESDGTVISFDGRVTGINHAIRPVAGLSNAEVLEKLTQALGSPAHTVDPITLRAGLAAAIGINPSELEEARSKGAVLPRKPARAGSLVPVRIDTTASTANIFSYASLNGILEKKLESSR